MKVQLLLCMLIGLAFADDADQRSLISSEEIALTKTIRSADHAATFHFHASLSDHEIDFVVKDLELLASIPDYGASTPLHRHFFQGPVSGNVYLTWLARRIDGFKRTSKRTYAAYVRGRDQKPGKTHSDIFLSNAYFSTKDQALRMSILLHEGRHVDGFKHARCRNKKVSYVSFDPISGIFRTKTRILRGLRCDDNAIGPYGAQAVFYFNYLRAHKYQGGHAFSPDERTLMDIYFFARILDERAVSGLSDDLLSPLDP